MKPAENMTTRKLPTKNVFLTLRRSAATDTGYYLYAMIALGEIAQRQGDKAAAKRYFTEVKNKAGQRDEALKTPGEGLRI